MRVTLVVLLIAACAPARAPEPRAPAPSPGAAPAAEEAETRDAWSSSARPEREPEAEPARRGDGPAILAAHNRYRADHCAGALSWSDDLAAEARRWADTLVDRDCAFEHNRGTPHGENLAFFGPPGMLDGEGVAAMWYEELEHYDFGHPGFSFEAGHFTQLVWVGTRELGCANAECGNGELWVCNYAPAGNVEGAFDRNVLPTSCK